MKQVRVRIGMFFLTVILAVGCLSAGMVRAEEGDVSGGALLASWNFDESSGNTVYDQSGNGCDAEVNTAHFSRVQGAAGLDSKAVRYHDYNEYTPDASEQYISLKDNTALPRLMYGKPAVTVMGMIKKNWNKTSSANDYHDLITVFAGAGNSPFPKAAFRVYISDSGIQYSGRSSDSDGFKTSAVVPLPALSGEVTDWHHVAVTADYENKTVRIYFDGVLLKEQAVSWNADAFMMTAPTRAARCHIGAAGLTVDDVSVWGRALSETEILESIPPVLSLKTDELIGGNGLLDRSGGEDSAYLPEGAAAELVDGVNGPAVKSTQEFRFDVNRITKKLIGASAVSAGTWFKGDVSESPYLWQTKVKLNSGSSVNGFSLQLSPGQDGATQITVGGRSGAAETSFRSFQYTAAIDNEKWHHIFATLDYKNKKGYLYLDGQLVHTQENMAFASDTYAGTNMATPNVYDTIGWAGMSIDSPALYNRAVSEREVQELYGVRPYATVTYQTESGYIDAPLSGVPVTAHVTVNNTGSQAEAVTVIFSRENEGILKELESRTLGEVEVNGQVPCSYQFKTIDENDRLAVYLWNNVQDLIPLSGKALDTQQRTEQRLFIGSPFSDHMVVQRGKPFVIWGQGVNGSQVSVSFNGQTQTVPVEGKEWSLTFENTEEMTDPALTVTDGTDTYTASEIRLGQVFVLAGQSNMEWSIRKFKIDPLPEANENVFKFDMLISESRPLECGDVPAGRWEACSADNISSFSYLGYQFADKLQRQLNEPVGVIQTAVGGTQISSWLTRAGFNKVSTVGGTTVSNHAVADPLWRYIAGQYNQKINPIGGYGISGILWYQGEADCRYPDYYYSAFGQLVDDWRALWNRRAGTEESLPFFTVQLPRYRTQDYAGIREAQWFAQFSRPDVVTVTSIDSGMEENIHPVDKTAVVDRLFGAVMTKVYRQPTPYEPAVYQSMQVSQDKVILTCTGVGEGLKTTTEMAELSGFEISADGETFVEASAQITGTDTIEVWGEGVANPTAVRYAWSPFPNISVYNSDGVPLAPFRTNSPYINQEG